MDAGAAASVAGLRSISPVVDATNFVLLELGQPMHAYDLRKTAHGGMQVRRATRARTVDAARRSRASCSMTDVLVIADAEGPVGMAGIMGGARSAVATSTTEVLLEVAWFDPSAIAGRARRYGLITDASQRYERGVDPAGQERAIERATELICAIAGGTAGPACLEELRAEVPVRAPGITACRAGHTAPRHGHSAGEVERRLRALGMARGSERWGQRWRVTPPPGASISPSRPT